MRLSRSFEEFTAQLLNVIGNEATISCCGGSNVDFIKELDKSPGRKAGNQYPFGLTLLQSEKLLHKPSFNVMGKLIRCHGYGLCFYVWRLAI